MEIRFSYEAESLRLIEEIPDIPICHIEGRNGIGKTLAVRLLQVALGYEPFESMPDAWESLRDSLTSCVITVTHLKGAESLVLTLRPDRWEDPEAPRADVQVDGKPATIDDARGLLHVERIAGDETLAATIAQDIRVYESLVAQDAETIVERVQEWEQQIASVSRSASSVTVSGYLEALLQLRNSRQKEQEAADLLKVATERRTATERLAEYEALAQQVAQDLPGLLNTQTDAQRAVAEANAQLNLSERNVHEFIAKRARGADAKQRIQSASSLHRRRRRAYDRADSDLAVQFQWLGLPVDSTQADLDLFADELAAQLQRTLLQRAELDVLGPLVAVTDELSQVLGSAVRGGMGSQIVADLDRPIAAAELHEGVTNRSQALAGEPRPGQLADLDQQIRAIRARLQQADKASALIKKRDRAGVLLDEVIQELDALTSRGSASSSTYAELQEALERTRRDLVSAEVHLREVESEISRLSETSPDQIAERIEEARSSLGLRTEATDAVLAELLAEETQLATNAGALAEQARAHAAKVEATRQTMQALSYDLDTADSLDWLRPAWNSVGPPPTNSAELEELGATSREVELASRIESLGILLEDFATMLLAVRDTANRVDDYLESLAADVSRRGGGGGQRGRKGTSLASANEVRRYLESHYSRQYSSPVLLSNLFDGAEAVHLNLQRLWLSWTTPEGSERQQPLESFSSGEQAFSYTLARLLLIGERDTGSKNVLVVLDEFGAFVARDRLGDLLRFVSASAEDVADQVVVILPLGEDYATLTPPPGDTTYATKIRQVKERGYFAIPAEASN